MSRDHLIRSLHFTCERPLYFERPAYPLPHSFMDFSLHQRTKERYRRNSYLSFIKKMLLLQHPKQSKNSNRIGRRLQLSANHPLILQFLFSFQPRKQERGKWNQKVTVQKFSLFSHQKKEINNGSQRQIKMEGTYKVSVALSKKSGKSHLRCFVHIISYFTTRYLLQIKFNNDSTRED